ncbi:lipoprotein [Caballeronia catudaia]|uniref:Lipoprotein n=1 Tax=Caballeronia catudaia TaxID=1777136 RepID=A0A158CF97_9BURK|nr:lipoprotein [Caballeronia catudaia]
MPGFPNIKDVRANLAFTCVHEADRLPVLTPDADRLFRYGRYLQTRDGPKDYDEIARYFRIAAAHGHYKANHNVQQLISRGMAHAPEGRKEVVDWAARLVDDGVPTGYYDIGYYLNSGYGLKQDREMALKYMRKAADLGNADAQFYISNLLNSPDKAPDIADQMLQCAADGGHPRAAYELGVSRLEQGQYREAVVAYQRGVVSGSSMAAFSLKNGFLASSEDKLEFLSLSKDEERSRRYEMIEKFLDENEYSNPKVPDIDKIVPLPPAKLPVWDGTFEWQKQHEQVVPQPSDELIERLAKEKRLDPATGLPLSDQQKSASATKVPLNTTVRALEECPQGGTWRACPPSGYVATPAERSFRKGEKLPLLDVEQPRAIAMLDSMLGVRRMHTDGVWQLISYTDEA